jgi:excisionase family DNA binding protein
MVNVTPTENLSEAPALPRLAYTMREAAAVLGISYMSMHRLVQRGLIRSSSALRTKVIPRSELERFLKSSLG